MPCQWRTDQHSRSWMGGGGAKSAQCARWRRMLSMTSPCPALSLLTLKRSRRTRIRPCGSLRGIDHRSSSGRRRERRAPAGRCNGYWLAASLSPSPPFSWFAVLLSSGCRPSAGVAAPPEMRLAWSSQRNTKGEDANLACRHLPSDRWSLACFSHPSRWRKAHQTLTLRGSAGRWDVWLVRGLGSNSGGTGHLVFRQFDGLPRGLPQGFAEGGAGKHGRLPCVQRAFRAGRRTLHEPVENLLQTVLARFVLGFDHLLEVVSGIPRIGLWKTLGPSRAKDGKRRTVASASGAKA